MEQSVKLCAILEQHCRYIASVKGDVALSASIKEFGYGTEQLCYGSLLADEVSGLLNSIENQYQQPYDIANSYWIMAEQAQRRYCAVVKQLNEKLTLDLELMKVIPPVVDALAQSESLHTAYNLYRHLLVNAERYADILSLSGISVMMLEEELGVLGEIAYLKTIRYRSLDEDENEIVNRDNKIEELISFVHDLKAVVSLANRKEHGSPFLEKVVLA